MLMIDKEGNRSWVNFEIKEQEMNEYFFGADKEKQKMIATFQNGYTF